MFFNLTNIQEIRAPAPDFLPIVSVFLYRITATRNLVALIILLHFFREYLEFGA